MPEQVIIEFAADPSGLTPVIEQLRNIGSISEEEFARFTNAAAGSKKALDETSKSITQMGDTKKSLDDLAKSASKVGENIKLGAANDSVVKLTASINDASKAYTVMYANELITTQEYENKILAVKNKSAEEAAKKAKDTAAKQKADFNNAIQQYQGYAQQVGQIMTQFVQNQLQIQMNGYDTEMQKYEAMHSSHQISDKQYAAEKKKIEEEELEAKKKAAAKEKQIKMGEAIISLAASILKTSEMGFPQAIPFIALAAVQGGLQIQAIANAKGFATGTKQAPAGFKWIGEQGPELIHDKGGYAIINHPDSMALMRKYEIPALAGSLVTRMASTPSLSPAAIEQMMKFTHTSTQIDYKQLAREIGNEFGKNISRLPEHKTIFDKNGFTEFVKKGNSETTYIGGRY